MFQARFRIGDVVHWTGIAAKVFCEETAVVLAVYPNGDGIELLDEYVVCSSSGRTGIYYSGELQKVSTATSNVKSMRQF
jgi:hypothetical protein